MSLSTRAFAGFVLIASALVLGTALLSQYWGGLAPCELCLLQRWPWAAAIVISLVVVLVGERARLDWVALALALVLWRKMPLPAMLSSQDWMVRLHSPKEGVPYGIALAAAGLLVYPQSPFVAALGV